MSKTETFFDMLVRRLAITDEELSDDMLQKLKSVCRRLFSKTGEFSAYEVRLIRSDLTQKGFFKGVSPSSIESGNDKKLMSRVNKIFEKSRDMVNLSLDELNFIKGMLVGDTETSDNLYKQVFRWFYYSPSSNATYDDIPRFVFNATSDCLREYHCLMEIRLSNLNALEKMIR